MAQTIKESIDVSFGVADVVSEWRCVSQGRQSSLAEANVVKQNDRVKLLELRRKHIFSDLGNGGVGQHALERRQRRSLTD